MHHRFHPSLIRDLQHYAVESGKQECYGVPYIYMHAYMTMHRATFRHVVHSGTLIHIDSASRAKLLTGAYELGILLNHPTFSEVCDAVANKIDKESKIYMHPIAKARLLIWGTGRTMDPHLAKRASAKSDTYERLHSVVWVTLNVWYCPHRV